MADEPIAPSPEPNAAPGGSPEPTAPPLAAPAPSSPAPDWRDAIPPEYAAEKVWEPYKDKPLGEVLKAHAEVQKLIGRAITLPGKDAKPEDVAKWKQTQLPKLVEAGLVAAPPASPDKYELTQAEHPHVPPINQQDMDVFKGVFHEQKLTQAQAQALVDANAKFMATKLQWANEQNLAMIQGLRDEWGEYLFEQRANAAKRGMNAVARKMGMDIHKVDEYTFRTLKGNDPILFQIMAGVGEAIGEDSSIGLEVAGIAGPEGAQAEIERIRASEAFKNGTHPGNAAALKKLEDLYKLREATTSSR